MFQNGLRAKCRNAVDGSVKTQAHCKSIPVEMGFEQRGELEYGMLRKSGHALEDVDSEDMFNQKLKSCTACYLSLIFF